MHKVRRVSRRVLRAALPHKCSLCDEPIEPGQEYIRIVSVVNEKFGTAKYHKPAEDGKEDVCKPKRGNKHWALR